MPEPQVADSALNGRMANYGRILGQSMRPGAPGAGATQAAVGAAVVIESVRHGLKSVSEAREYAAQALVYVEYLNQAVGSYHARFCSDIEEDQKNAKLAIDLCRSLRRRTEDNDFQASDLCSLMVALEHVTGMFEGMANRYAD
jgi:hypothetical protein